MKPAGADNDAWMQTYTGKRFYPLAPRVEDVDIQDIAHSLAHQCRFNGHCHTFYSVAEHCLHVSDYCYEVGGLWPALVGLLHDAAEAYVSDVVAPLKRTLAGFQEAEDRVMLAILDALDLHVPHSESVRIWDVVSEADQRLLATEARTLMDLEDMADWGLDSDLVIRFYNVGLHTAEAAKELYLDRYEFLKKRIEVLALDQGKRAG